MAGADNKLRIGQRGKNKPTHLIRKLIDSILLKKNLRFTEKITKQKMELLLEILLILTISQIFTLNQCNILLKIKLNY